jgi:hypothetical protein
MRVIALVMLVACGGDNGMSGVDGGPGSSGASGPLVECVTQTNVYRQMNGKPALTESSQLEAYAAAGAMYDYQNMSAHDHFAMTQGGGIAFAENECPGFDGWNIASSGGDMKSLMDMCLQAFYDEGPGSDYSTHGHYINMMGDYNTLGCGIYEDSSTGDVTITQDYGICDPSAPTCPSDEECVMAGAGYTCQPKS